MTHTIEIPPGATWVQVKELILQRDVITPFFEELASVAERGRRVPYFHSAVRPLFGVEAKSCRHPRPVGPLMWEDPVVAAKLAAAEVAAVTLPVARRHRAIRTAAKRAVAEFIVAELSPIHELPDLTSTAPIEDGQFIMLFRCPLTPSVKNYVQSIYEQKYPRKKTETACAEPVKILSPEEVEALSMEEQCARILRHAETSWAEESQRISSAPRKTLRQCERESGLADYEQTCPIYGAPPRPSARGLDPAFLRAPRTPAEQITAMVTPQGDLVVPKSPERRRPPPPRRPLAPPRSVAQPLGGLMRARPWCQRRGGGGGGGGSSVPADETPKPQIRPRAWGDSGSRPAKRARHQRRGGGSGPARK